MPVGKESRSSEIAEKLRETAEDLVELVSKQVKLIRLELHGDARALGTRLARLAVFLPVVIIGYTFLAAAGTFALGQVIGLTASFAIVGGVHAVVGTWGLVRATRAVRSVRVLDRSRDELERSLEKVSETVKDPAPAAAAGNSLPAAPRPPR